MSCEKMLLISGCTICLDDEVSDFCAISCGHVYHPSCIADWMRHNPQCPQCRATIDPNIKVKLFVQSASQELPRAGRRKTSRRSLENDLVAVHESLTQMVEEQRRQIQEKDELIRNLQEVNQSLTTSLQEKDAMVRAEHHLLADVWSTLRSGFFKISGAYFDLTGTTAANVGKD